jgi:hypothetical protein
MHDDETTVGATDPSDADHGGSQSTSASSKPSTKSYERLNLDFCFVGTKRAETGGAISKFCDVVPEEFFGQECAGDEVVMQPLFVRTWGKRPDGTTGWGDPEYAPSKRCVGAPDLAAAARKAFKTLKISPSPMHVPSFKGGLVMINIETVTYTDATPQDFAVTLLGIPVQVQAVPASFTWSFTSDGYADGTVTTRDPGTPLPDFTLSHTFTHAGAATVSLATTWEGRFRIAGTVTDPDDPASWTPIPGQAHTDSGTTNLTVYTRTSHLVEDLTDQ